MPGGRRIPITVEADTHGDFRDAADGLDKVAKSGDDADKSLGKLTKGHQALDAEINKTAYSVKALRAEFEKTGDLDLLKDARKLDGTRKSLERFKKDLTDNLTTAGDEGGKGLVAKLGATFSSGLSSLPAPAGMTQWLALGAVAAAPAIGAAINAGVLLGVGGGALAAGLVAAAQDERVKSAWAGTIDDIKSGFTAAAGPLVAPLVNGAQKVDDAFGRMLPGIQRGMAQLGPVVDRLVDGVVGMVEKAGPGFGRAFEASLPLLKQVGDEMPKLGSALSSFFDSMARGGPGAVMFFHDLMAVVDLTVVHLGLLTEGLSKVYAAGHDKFGQLLSPLGMLSNMLDDSGKKGKDAAENLNQVGDAAAHAGLGVRLASGDFSKLSAQINATREDSDALAGQMVGKLFNSMMSLDQATLGFARSQTSLADSIKQNGLELDIHTAKGEANRSAILGVVQSNMQAYQANIAVGMSAGDAAKAYDDNTAALERQLQKAHFTQAEIDGLIGKYRGVPAKVDTDIATHGLTAAINGLEDAIRLANHLNGRVVTMTVEEVHRTTYTNDIAPSQFHRGVATGGMRTASGIRMAAVGMFIPPSDPGTVLTGEPQTGGEWLIPAQGISPGRAAMLGNAALGNYGLDVVPRSSGYASPVMARGGGGTGGAAINLTMSASGSGTAFEQSMATWVMYAVRIGLIQLETENGGRVRVG